MREEIAEKILEAYSTNNTCAPVRNEMTELSLEEAYAIQSINNSLWIKNGRRPVGRKIGLTSKIVQKQLGVDQPDFGFLFADMAYGSGETIDINKLIQPKAEAEIALVLKRDLPHKKNTIADIINATDFALPAIEIVDSRIENWDIKIYDTIADNASSGLFVLGAKPTGLEEVDLELCGMVMECKGEPVSSGAGIACMGNPLNAATWLADKMVEVGTPLKAGDIILTGALGPMVPIKPGDSFSVKISGLGEVSIGFSNNS